MLQALPGSTLRGVLLLVVELVVQDEDLDACLEAIQNTARTGKIGDGKIFVCEVERVIRIRTGEENEDAI
jgi:nitrogen regulatory protein P-II 1